MGFKGREAGEERSELLQFPSSVDSSEQAQLIDLSNLCQAIHTYVSIPQQQQSPCKDSVTSNTKAT